MDLGKVILLFSCAFAFSAFSAPDDLAKAEGLRLSGQYGKAERALKKYSTPQKVYDNLKPAEKISYLRGVLELAHVRALKEDVNGALLLLNWAEGRKEPYQRALACVKYGRILVDLGEMERASAYLKNADEVIRQHVNPEDAGAVIGQGGEAADTGAVWRDLQDDADVLKAEIESERLKKKFGASYANYVKLRRLEVLLKRARTPRYMKEANALADELMKVDPASQFAAAAGYLKGSIAASRLKEKSPKKEIKAVKDYLNEFVRQKPDGIYRGEALMLLGKISLEIEWNAKEAEKHYGQALNWFRKAREKRDALSLYAGMNDELKKQVKPTQKPTTLNQWKRIVYHDEDPLKLYNTANAPVWYMDDKEKNCVFALGMMKFTNGDFAGAAKLWKGGKHLDRDIANMDSRLPNVYTRLLSACNMRYMMFTPEEKRAVKDEKLKLKIQYAEYAFLQEKFEDAQKIFQKLLKIANNDFTRAILTIGLADCAELNAKGNYKKDAGKLYETILQNNKLRKTDIYALALYRYALSLMGTVPGQQTAYKLCLAYIKEFPKGRNIREMNFYVIRFLILNGDKANAKRKLSEFSRIQDGYARYLQEIINK